MSNIIAPALAAFATAFAHILARIGFKASAQQLAIFAWFAQGSGNLVVRARAGTGKTTTIIAALGFAKERNILVAAFSKDIADELTARVKNIALANPSAKIDARSLHSLGNGLCWYYLGGKDTNGTEVDPSRGRRLARKAIEATGLPAHSEMVTLVNKLASLGKNMAPFATKGADLYDIAVRFQIIPEPAYEIEGWTVEVIADLAVAAMNLATVKETNGRGQAMYDYDDQIFLPVRMKWARPKFDLVIIDEAQDMNYTQLLLAQRVARGRIVVVGDNCQAIYGFRGADSDSLDRLKTELRASELGLTVTYRCGRKIVALAKELVPDYEAAENAHEGEIVDAVNWDVIYKTAEGGDFVLSRTNAQVTKICLRLLRMGKRAFIRGRDVGKGLKMIVEKLDVATIPEVVTGARQWAERQIEFLKAKSKDGEIDEKVADAVYDQSETIIALCEDLTTVPELLARIDALFSEDKGSAFTICCSSIHRAKGLETNRVFLLVDTLRYGSTEERNIAYVGITRAKNTLVRVRGVHDA